MIGASTDGSSFRGIVIQVRHVVRCMGRKWAASLAAAARSTSSSALHQRSCSFTQSSGSDALDASVLVIPHFGFLPGSDPRVRGTVAAIEKSLLRDGFVLRYDTEHGPTVFRALREPSSPAPSGWPTTTRSAAASTRPRRYSSACWNCVITWDCYSRNTSRRCDARSGTSRRRSRISR